ncbi:MAG: elongation factor Ts [Gammaproteobacteria bacterium]|nr:MAG: elongation factor Ts [Gammaproteobacteria bacterium]
MAVTAAMVKELRERTGAGMMECKKALVEANGDIELAIENMRKSGQAKAAKKAGRIAAEGIILTRQNGSVGVIVEINCETDFVARDENFLNFANEVADLALNNEVDSLEQLLNATMASGETVSAAREALVAKIGENIQVRRVEKLTGGALADYLHGTRIGVLVAFEGEVDADLAKDIAMHIAASAPQVVSADDVPAEMLEKEREIFTAQAKDSGKPEEIIAKMVEGRLRKFVNEVSLEGQPFVKNPDVTVGKLLKEKGVKVIGFKRYEVGEGIEKKQENFAEEVMAQLKG